MILEKSAVLLETALKNGGAVLVENFGGSIEAVIKESISSVVTKADLDSEKAIIHILESGPDSFNILSEESGYMDHQSLYTWVIDPLDGTSNFAAGLPWFGVIISLLKGLEPIMAGMYLPIEKSIYFAQKGKGAWKNGNPIQVSTSKNLEELLLAYSFDFSSESEKTDAEMRLLGILSKRIRNTRSTNSLIDFCITADGRLGGAINQTTKIWDIAAPWLIIREAGGIVTDISGKKISFNLEPENMNQNYTIVASGAGIHEQLIKIINP